MPPATPQTPGTQTLDPSQDQDFLKASPSDQHNYLMATDPDYANASMKDKFAYLQHVNGLDKDPNANKQGFWGAVGEDVAGIPKGIWHLLSTPPEQTVAEMAGSGIQQWQREKQAGYGLPYRIGAALASTAGTNVQGMEDAAAKGDPNAVLGHATVGATQAAAPLIAEGVSKGYQAVKDFNEPGRVAEGQARVKGALGTPAGPQGSRAIKMEGDINTAKGDLADIFRDTKLKGTDAEKFGQAADAIKDWKDNLWDTSHTPMVQNNAHLPFDSQAVLQKTLDAIDPLDDSVQANKARNWANREIPKMQTLGDADAKIRLINQDPALKKGAPNPYDAVGTRVRQTAVQASRQQLDTHLINDAGEQGLQDYPDANGNMIPGVNKRWGALNNIEDQLRTRAEQLEKSGAGKSGLLPKALHGYLFAHSLTEMPNIGVGLNAAKMLDKTPGKLLETGLGKISDSHLSAPEVNLGPGTPPGQRPGGVAPTGPNFPQTSGGTPPNGPIRGLLPPAGGGSGPATSAGPGGGIFPTNPAASSGRVPSAIPVPERTPSPILPPERQLPPAGGTGTGGAPNSDVMAPKVGTQPLQPTQMPASPPQATVSPYLTGKHDFAIIPAETPVHRAIAMKELRGQGYHPQVITGASEGQPGTSLFIPDMPTHAALDFQQHMTSSYGQQTPQSIITKQGLINLDRGTATPIDFSRTIFGPDAAAKPSYSIATGGSESMPFALNPSGKEIPIKTPYEGEHYSDTVPAGAKRISGSRGVQASPDTAARLQVSPNDAVPRVYFQDKGTVAMGPTGKNVHAFKGELSIADISTNPTYKNAYIQAAQEAQSKGVPPNAIKAFARTKAESALQQAGWDGYRNPKFPGITAKFGDADVFKPGEEPEAPPLEPHPNAPEPTVQPAPSPTSRGASAKPSAPKRVANNGSGGGPNSLEAQGRVKAENAKGIQRFRIDTRSGQATPIMNTVDAADVRPGPFDVIVQRQGGTETVQDRGIRATYPFPSGQKWR